jgi:hypothetical protein
MVFVGWMASAAHAVSLFTPPLDPGPEALRCTATNVGPEPVALSILICRKVGIVTECSLTPITTLAEFEVLSRDTGALPGGRFCEIRISSGRKTKILASLSVISGGVPTASVAAR